MADRALFRRPRSPLHARGAAAFLLGLCCAAGPAAGQDGAPDLLALLREAEPRGALAVIATLEAVADEVLGTPDADLWMDLLATRLTFVHEAEAALWPIFGSLV